jgi:hypothetical protein
MTEKKEFNITIDGPKHHGGVRMGLAIAEQLRASLPGVPVTYNDNVNDGDLDGFNEQKPRLTPQLTQLLIDNDVTINIKVTV